jgi:hypothetical protein
MRGVTLLEVLDDAQGMQVVVEAQPVPLQAFVERALTGVAEGRVADVVYERKRLGEVLIESERLSYAARDLHHLDGVGQAAAEVVGGAAGENLSLAGETAEGARLHDAFAIALECSPRGPLGRGKHTGPQHIVHVGGDAAQVQIGARFSVGGHRLSVTGHAGQGKRRET